jgi:hypothetical protein
MDQLIATQNRIRRETGTYLPSFEASGPADRLRSALQATATLVFAQALPGGVEPGPDESRSYAEWLYRRPGARRDAGV